MSEKELRRELPIHLCPDEDGERCPYCERVWGLLAADPDAVVAARYALDKADRQIFAEFSRGRQSAFLDMANWLQRTFHFLLTPDGWEWMKEER